MKKTLSLIALILSFSLLTGCMAAMSPQQRYDYINRTSSNSSDVRSCYIKAENAARNAFAKKQSIELSYSDSEKVQKARAQYNKTMASLGDRTENCVANARQKNIEKRIKNIGYLWR